MTEPITLRALLGDYPHTRSMQARGLVIDAGCRDVEAIRSMQSWGLKTIEAFHTHGTPPIEQYPGPRRK